MRRPSPPALLLALTAACGGGTDRNIIQNTGSDTMLDVAQAWAERYQEVNAAVAVAVSGGGSGTGIASMIDGTVDISNSSRPMTEREIASARANGNDPVEHIVPLRASSSALRALLRRSGFRRHIKNRP